MATKAGAWIDHKQAIVVLVTKAGTEVKKINSDIEGPAASAGRPRSAKSYTKNDFLADDRRERKIEDHRKKYYNEVIALLRGATDVLIIGPGEAKAELRKCIKSKKLRVAIVELETTDKMTDRQIVAKVAERFASVSSKKSVSSRNLAAKKMAKAISKQPRKKSAS